MMNLRMNSANEKQFGSFLFARGCDVAVVAFVVRLVYGDISRNIACVQRQIVNWFSGSKTISADKSL